MKTSRHLRIFAVITTVFLVFSSVFAVRNVRGAVGISQFRIVIDAGHGGIDGGAVGVITKNHESNLNLDVARRLSVCLQNAAMTPVLTRTDENGLYGTTESGYKRRDMEKRKEITNKATPDAFVSIHMNKSPLRYRKGAQAYFQQGDGASQTFANVVQSVLNATVNTEREYSALSGDFYVCKTANCPAIIVECGFLSNPEDDVALSKAEYRQKIAFAIYSGIAEYLAVTTFETVDNAQ